MLSALVFDAYSPLFLPYKFHLKITIMAKRILIFIMPALLAALLFTSCEKEVTTVKLPERAVLKISFSPINSSSVTKATGSNHGNSTNDAFVNTLQIFVFSSDGSLDAYKVETGSPVSLKSGTTAINFDITVAKGIKDIYAIANSHDVAGFASIKTKTDLISKTSNIKKEDVKNFFMIGYIENENVTGDKTVTLQLNRHISRIELKSVQTAFTGGYSGEIITNVKAYLINVNSSSTITGTGGMMLNQGHHIASDTTGFEMPAMLGSSLPNITSTYSNSSNFFYCYENNSQTAKTMLVVEGTLNAKTYYYPIIICDNILSETYSLSKNTSYEITNMIITRPGSDSPDKEVEKGTISVSMTVTDWTTKTIATITI